MVRNLAITGVINFGIMMMLGFKFIFDVNEYSFETFQNPLIVICAATSMIIAKIVLQECHLIVYSFNGTGFLLLKFLATYIFVMG